MRIINNSTVVIGIRDRRLSDAETAEDPFDLGLDAFEYVTQERTGPGHVLAERDQVRPELRLRVQPHLVEQPRVIGTGRTAVRGVRVPHALDHGRVQLAQEIVQREPRVPQVLQQGPLFHAARRTLVTAAVPLLQLDPDRLVFQVHRSPHFRQHELRVVARILHLAVAVQARAGRLQKRTVADETSP